MKNNFSLLGLSLALASIALPAHALKVVAC